MRFSLVLPFAVLLAGCASSSPGLSASAEPSACPAQASRNVQLFGEFERPGTVPYTPGLTVFAAIQRGGGLRSITRPAELRILRCGRVLGPFAPPAVRGADTDLLLEPGDVLDSPWEYL